MATPLWGFKPFSLPFSLLQIIEGLNHQRVHLCHLSLFSQPGAQHHLLRKVRTVHHQRQEEIPFLVSRRQETRREGAVQHHGKDLPLREDPSDHHQEGYEQNDEGGFYRGI